ncbi:dUTP diphosphatase [Bacillus velezensis]|uniref:dUTP diphosphatase n=1 Tax=Bacillus velezensis TaxID=492670 RepID=UPI001E32C136|nr:dUTP diphosphatase [Bacillus velezensis]MCD7911021.1 dUTP diphosphatase [Bacillus velezensis]
MKLHKMFEIQMGLDDRIIKKRGLEDQNLLPELILALQVELAKCANEWRGFKYWSNNQKPRTKSSTNVGATPENAAFFRCENNNCGEYLSQKDFENLFDPDYEECPICKVGYVTAFRDKNPLFEKYVDCLHFILSIGNCLDFNDPDTINHIIAEYLSIPVTFNVKWLFSSLISTVAFTRRNYINLFINFFSLGECLGFKWEYVEAAYMEKNAENYQMQQEDME